MALLGLFYLNKACTVDVDFIARGGGLKAQAESCKVALARCLQKAFPEFAETIRGLKLDYIDKRQREPKKTSSWGARRSYTYVRR